MKFLVILILLGVIGGGAYFISAIEIESDVEITGRLQRSQQTVKAINDTEATGLLYFIVIKGKVKNNLKKPLKNVFIKYNIGGQQTSATIFDIAPGQVLDFNTKGIQTSVANPEYSYEGVYYDETSL
ncbi:MAG: hypothetical protein DRQ13_10095 [Ignavibacteriae bacterium]|nr:MAG: hypothetical protein DRQ13_10095 [Ignavibacteriota bacterium]